MVVFYTPSCLVSVCYFQMVIWVAISLIFVGLLSFQSLKHVHVFVGLRVVGVLVVDFLCAFNMLLSLNT